MPKSRASIFEEEGTPLLDVSSFAPKGAIDSQAPQPEEVREVSKTARFTSREPKKIEEKPEKRPRRRYRTGRNVQLSVKALATTVDMFYAVTDSQGWVLGYTLQRAMEALQRELKQPK